MLNFFYLAPYQIGLGKKTTRLFDCSATFDELSFLTLGSNKFGLLVIVA
mgnify:CR=1 FL=1